jgi:hypothetical protein
VTFAFAVMFKRSAIAACVPGHAPPPGLSGWTRKSNRSPVVALIGDDMVRSNGRSPYRADARDARLKALIGSRGFWGGAHHDR